MNKFWKTYEQMVLKFFLSHSFTVLVETGGLSDYFKFFFFISNFKYNNWNWNKCLFSINKNEFW